MFRKNISGSIFNSLPKWHSLTAKPEYYVRLRYPRTEAKDFVDAKQEYKKLLKEYRLKNIQEYWERQTQVENEYIERWNRQQEEKHHRDMIKLRNSVVRISGATARHIQERIQNETKKLNNIKKYLLEEHNKKANRLQILKMLNLDSKTWYTLENIEKKMKAEVLIPDFVYDQTNYYLKLQEQALYYQTGDFDGLEESMNDSEVTRIKNMRLMPLYAEVVSLIKHIHNNPETKLLEEFQHLKSLILQKTELSESEKNAKIEKLRASYKTLLEKEREESQITSNKIKELNRQLILLYNLLKLWEQYIDVVKMDNNTFMQLLGQEREKDKIKILSVDEIEEAGQKKEAEKAQKYSDALTSANERFTSDEEEGYDGEKISLPGLKDPRGLAKNLNEIDKSRQAEDEGISRAHELMNSISDKDMAEFEKEFESQFSQAAHKEKFLYGLRQDKEVMETAKFLEENPIESFIPKGTLDSISNFAQPKIEYQSLQDIEEKEILEPNENVEILNSSAIVEIYKRKLDEIQAKEGLSRKEMNKLKELKKLLNRVGEIRVQEPKLLLRIFDLYGPTYSLD